MRMRHPDLDGRPPVVASPRAFQLVWRPRGWVDADDPPPKKTKKSTTKAPIGGLSHATTEEG